MKNCPFCEKYIEHYLEHDENDFDHKRINDGFWGSIAEVLDEHWLMNKVIDMETALKMRLPIQIQMSNGETTFGRIWCYTFAEKREHEKKEIYSHFWIVSGVHMKYMTPICCEFANLTSEDEAIEWEQEHFNK